MSVVILFDLISQFGVEVHEYPPGDDDQAMALYRSLEEKYREDDNFDVQVFLGMSLDQVVRDWPWKVPPGPEEPEHPLAPRTKLMPPKELEKALGPRNIPPAFAVSGLRELEDDWVKQATEAYLDASARAARVRSTRGLAKLFEGLRGRLSAQGQNYGQRIWQRVLEGFTTEFPEAAFTHVDQSALEVLRRRPDGFLDAITSFEDEQVEAFRPLIEEYFTTPGADFRRLIDRMEEVSQGQRSKLENIARSETTRISNEARAVQYEKYGDPSLEEYHWTRARDDRVCPICIGLSQRNPWNLSALRKATNNFLPHPRCRCVVDRRPLVFQ